MNFITSFIPRPLRRQIQKALYEHTLHQLPRLSAPTSPIELRTLLCHQHVLLFLYSITSFFGQLGQTLPILVLDDGSLTAEDRELIAAKCQVTFYNKKQLLEEISPRIKRHPHLVKFFADPKVTVKKLRLGLTLLPGNQSILYEADLLFFRPPTEVLKWLQGSFKKRMYLTMDEFAVKWLEHISAPDLYFRKLLYKTLRVQGDIHFNGGLCLLTKVADSEVEMLDKACALFYEIGAERYLFSDELLLSFLVKKGRDISLSSRSYACVWSDDHYATISPNPVMVHYAGNAKPIFERDALRTVESSLASYSMGLLASQGSKTG